MKIAYFDCFSGASGDMILGSMIDAGLNAQKLREELRKIPIPKVQLNVKNVQKEGSLQRKSSSPGRKRKNLTVR